MQPILTRLRVPAGFLLAGLYIWLAHPTWPLWLAGIVLAFLGMLFRGWAAGHVLKNDRLAVSGPYAFTRHPLYLGSFVIGLGFSLAGSSLTILVLFLGFFFLLYGPAMRAEEERLKHLFPARYPDYRKTVPFFLPTRWPAGRDPASFSLQHYRRNREYRAVLGFAAALGLLAWKAWWF
ncbi:MAG: isoprenylcysteine carboxylmethyltransferase family protein [Acidobacteria bacterium]|nr:isoprenylcysteine carboxylmethyltransferase family protein [Acidobacteriota bacterium]